MQYTPEHMHCFATFYGPLVPPNTGLLAIQSLSGQQAGFRVSATGVVLEFDASFPVCKKLKLVGYPSKVFKNTAFVRSMFGSDLEVRDSEVDGWTGVTKVDVARSDGMHQIIYMFHSCV